MKSLVALFCLALAGCASGHCRSQSRGEPRKPASAEELSMAFEGPEREPQARRVKVFKADGSKQCEKDSGITLIQMERELDHIKVYSSTKGEDGQIHGFGCRMPSGRTNVFEIDEADLSEAKKRGFQLLTR